MSKVSRPRTSAERKERIQRILDALHKRYPNVTCALHHKDAWQLLVATILSAQCTDERVNMVTPALFAQFPTMQDLALADVREVAQVVRSTGFFNNKAKNIVGAARTIIRDFGGEIPKTIEQLLTVPGAARKTSNVVLGTAFGIPSGVVVDTHVGRISVRLDLTKQTNPAKVEQDLMKILPQDHWILFSHQVIHFGREICVARKPRCGQCPVENLCYAKDKAVL
ncbi:endonuclease III [uncultured Paludibaculum sp.]|uniref:endonuclease III n=1 Tax=uncultured Paludibaculum sp. TaxID=1765020 RepID=UPI002AAA92B0|nr:endonuclease III [uncultured Paludibaculum sp.]